MTIRRVILGIDPASACGWARVEFPSGLLLNRGVWTLQHGRLEGGGMMFVRLETWLLEVTAQRPTLIAMEEVKRHLGTAAAHLYGGITAIISRVCEEIDVPYTAVPVGTWKKLATGRGNASKDEVLVAAKIRWGHGALTHNWKQDEADAAFIALTAGAQLGWLRGGTR
jgi:Holliday junction resolvasome RuvABC endonuclease subunit